MAALLGAVPGQNGAVVLTIKKESVKMNITYTPGRWRIGDNPYDIVADEYRVIARIEHDQQGLRRGKEESDAHARLVAAAPDLLAASKAALVVLEADSDSEEDNAPEIASLKAAIARAEGGAQ